MQDVGYRMQDARCRMRDRDRAGGKATIYPFSDPWAETLLNPVCAFFEA
jgi:hypothetical protein